ncbi:aspartate-semialdehyde dehydrogenase [Virgibacillus phasianinus]|uniref:Aspartate-semialdehyde dehydrogenase n=1 Tax=Virgibacillus phasianinus TaxID=2017483 RepID=A0A220U6P7_9BACI|nr:aspartate-semialdehyde dehydrogenase [Virgibacillus phasianinus]ASK63797.1 aspartate-semialdehyde dehydrogenase [Virgibacillus phasianinus]
MVKIAVVGATGLVGRKMIDVLEKKDIPCDELVLFSSSRSAGKELTFRNKTYRVEELTEARTAEGFDYVLMSAGGSTSLKFSPLFEQNGAIVIDNSSAFRMDPTIDLIVPEVNRPVLNRKIIANPNCSTIQSVIPLKVLEDAFGVKRVSYTTYQAVSGSGVNGIQDLKRGENGEAPMNYPHPIYNNAIPHIDVFFEDGYTKEEVKMIEETRKILGLNELKVTATCVRVPVENSHGVAMNVTLDDSPSVAELKQVFDQNDHVVLQDDPQNNVYPTQLGSAGKEDVFVGRIRKDESMENTYHLWVTSDNLLKGAALNAVQILQQLIDTKEG